MKLIRQHEELTEKAKHIFGYIVTAAFLVEDSIEKLNTEEDNLNDQLSNSSENQINYDTLTIQIKFTSGHTVQFQNSEWASIRKIKEE